MTNTFLKIAAVAVALAPAAGLAQSKPTAATYITDEEVKAVNALPGVDRTIRVVDVGPENFAVGIIHRGATGAARGAAAAGGGAAGAARVSGSCTLVTGGKIVNGRKSGPDNDVTKILNGPSCSGTTVGADVVKRVVKT